tara:strand:- start:529 stop:1101 length:573 start_codon:yes stop_codon:yes gene_type:complete
MPRKIIKTSEPVVLEGYQSVLQVSQYGNHQLEAILDSDIIDGLENDRLGGLDWARSKCKNPSRAKLNDEPWTEVAQGKYKTRFTWTPDKMPVIVDTEGTPISDMSIDLRSGSKVKIAFYQKPYRLPNDTIGTKLVMNAIQIVSVTSNAGVDIGDDEEVDVSELFGTTTGFKQGDPNVIPAPIEEEVDDDF